MARKVKKYPVRFVRFSYVGTDNNFNKFLKTVLRDYLSADIYAAHSDPKFVEKVENKSVRTL
jgi:hypothetical protein